MSGGDGRTNRINGDPLNFGYLYASFVTLLSTHFRPHKSEAGVTWTLHKYQHSVAPSLVVHYSYPSTCMHSFRCCRSAFGFSSSGYSLGPDPAPQPVQKSLFRSGAARLPYPLLLSYFLHSVSIQLNVALCSVSASLLNGLKWLLFYSVRSQHNEALPFWREANCVNPSRSRASLLLADARLVTELLGRLFTLSASTRPKLIGPHRLNWVWRSIERGHLHGASWYTSLSASLSLKFQASSHPFARLMKLQPATQGKWLGKVPLMKARSRLKQNTASCTVHEMPTGYLVLSVR